LVVNRVGLLTKVIKKRTARGKSANQFVVMTFAYPGVFDTPYKPDVHRRFVLNEIRFRTRQKGIRKTKSRIAYDLKEARRWKEAILRNAPLLSGFFAEEPAWREKMLSWCQETLEGPHGNQP
jgi:hypothetical protein